ncbi:MAG: hypothetical protein HY688_01290 [Chloroflexi bacterium]|nr:hypothetical protein [Chloroflexota bacterium]
MTTTRSRQDQRARRSAAQVASLVLTNALIFQEVLSQHDGRVQTLAQTLQTPDPATAFTQQWQFILTQINYYPIFHVAREILLGLSASPEVDRGLSALAQRARDVVRLRAAFRHDLMGRVYHTLLAEAKYLGTYYTSVPAATLLLKLALDPARWPGVDWADLDQVARLHIGDLACGTGTLLMAAADAVGDNYTAASARASEQPDLDALHRRLIELALYGYDVLPSAIHLTASTVALQAPGVPFQDTHLYSLPLGGPDHRLGSIEFLQGTAVQYPFDPFRVPLPARRVGARGETQQAQAPLPNLDLCVMNPPFTRSVGGNLLFGSVPESERGEMQKRLAQMLRRASRRRATPVASSTAGLGSVFVAVAHPHIRPGGRLALVLPKALLSGVAWEKTRQLVSQGYTLEALVVSHDPRPDPDRGTAGRWNFSDNTDLSEVLVLARKLEHGPTAETDNALVLCVNLWANPSNVWDALAVARSLRQSQAPDLEHGQGALPVSARGAQVGEAVTIRWGRLRQGAWLLPCAFAQADLARAATSLIAGYLRLPTQSTAFAVPLTPLQNLGQLGPDRRDIYDGFALASTRTSFAAFWSHDAPLVTTIAQTPNRWLSPLPAATPGRPLRRATDLWPRAGRLLLAERLWLKTQRLAAVRLPEPVLSNVWWPLALAAAEEAQEKALALWLNSTSGLLTLLAHREETRGAWVDFKKPVLAAMPVLNVSALSPAQLDALAHAYDRLAQQPLQPFPLMDQDPVRREIDAAVSQALGLPDVRPLRDLLAREPGVCLRPLA